MGIFDALNTAVTGLTAQSFALQNISGNIANSQTTAFKGTSTEFENLLSQQAAPGHETSGSVLASSASTITVQGDIQATSVGTNMAVNGDGFFVVQRPTGFTGGTPSFNGVNLYTRRGDFQVQDGYLVNGSGYYLMGVPIDPKTGNPVGSVPQLLQFQNNFLPAAATSQVDYGANLPTNPTTQNTNPNVPNSDLMNPNDFISNPLNVNAQPAKLNGTGAALAADVPASVTGTVDASGYSAAAAGNIVIDGVTIPVALNDTSATIAANITASAAGVTATVNGVTGFVTLTGKDAGTTIDVTGGTPAILAGMGINVASTPPVTNLLTQNAVAQGETLVVQFAPPPPGAPLTATTITFGTNPGQIASMAAVNTALSTTLNGGSGTINAQGDITLTAGNLTNSIAISGTVTPSVFGLQHTSALPPSKTVIGSDNATFLNESVGGGAITAYDNAGSPANIQFRWAKTDSANIGPGHADTWNLFYATNTSATGTQTAWVNVGTNFTFGANGALSPPITSVTLPNVSVNGVTVGSVQLQFGSGGLTQFADTNGVVNVNLLQQNGYAAGKLQTLGVSDKGRITGAYSNGQTVDLASVTLAAFSGESFLQSVTGGAYGQTDASGVPVYNATGSITPSSLEGSNTDIADEFTKMIVTQQAYSANARVITTSNQMLQVAMNMVQ
jgi:flagellar hook protein FlgE